MSTPLRRDDAGLVGGLGANGPGMDGPGPDGPGLDGPGPDGHGRGGIDGSRREAVGAAPGDIARSAGGLPAGAPGDAALVGSARW
jgi:hypothetical protein